MTSTVKSYLNFRLFQHLLVCLLSVTLAATSSTNYAEGRNTNGIKIAYGSREGELRDQGRVRSYYIYTPKSYNSRRSMPLVMVLHGHGGSGRSIAHVSRFNDLAEQKGFIAVYPDGINQEWNLRGGSRGDDVSFVSHLIEHLQQTRNINSRRIYVTGFSKGAILAQALACRLPDKVAAFGSVAGSLPVRLKSNCQPSTPVSMLMINGTNDQSVPYHGEGGLVSVPGTVSFWREHDRCPSSPQVRQIEGSPHDDVKVKISQYSGCRGGSEVYLASVVNGGHFWPGGVSTDGTTRQINSSLGFSASRATWNFFQRHSL